LLESFDLTKLGLKGRARKIDFNQKSGCRGPGIDQGGAKAGGMPKRK
jgi:hypothetical protein